MDNKKEKKKEPKKAKLDEDWEGNDEEREDEPLFEDGAPEADVPAFLAGGALRAKQVWSRPPVSEDLAACKLPLVFQTMEVDYTHGVPLPGMPGNTVGQVPVLRVYGVTGEGQSVLCNVHGFLPYLWIPAPPDFRPGDVDMVRRTLNARMERYVLLRGRVVCLCVFNFSFRQLQHFCGQSGARIRVERVAARAQVRVRLLSASSLLFLLSFFLAKRSIMMYNGDSTQPFLKIVVALPKHIPTLRRILESRFPSFFSSSCVVFFPLFSSQCDAGRLRRALVSDLRVEHSLCDAVHGGHGHGGRRLDRAAGRAVPALRQPRLALSARGEKRTRSPTRLVSHPPTPPRWT